MNQDEWSRADLLANAERELGAFLRAVTERFGPEFAPGAAEDWLDELELMNTLPAFNVHGWESITVAAAVRLAKRVNAASD